MNLRKLDWFLLLIFGFGFGGCAQAPKATSQAAEQRSMLSQIVEKGTLVMGTTGDMPPMSMTTRSGELIGFDIDLGKSIADAMGVKLDVKTMHFSELLASLRAGQIDLILSGMSITPQRNLNVAFAGPYLVSGKCILTKQEALADADEPADIDRADVKLAVLKGSTSETFVKTLIPKAQSIASDHPDDMLDMLLSNRVDALIADYPVCVVSMLRHPDQGLISVLSLLTQEPLGIAMPADALLINWMDNYLQYMVATGQLEEMKSRWFDDDSWLKELP